MVGELVEVEGDGLVLGKGRLELVDVLHDEVLGEVNGLILEVVSDVFDDEESGGDLTLWNAARQGIRVLFSQFLNHVVTHR